MPQFHCNFQKRNEIKSYPLPDKSSPHVQILHIYDLYGEEFNDDKGFNPKFLSLYLLPKKYTVYYHTILQQFSSNDI